MDRLERDANAWLLDSEIRQHSPATLSFRRLTVRKLLWFLRSNGHEVCGKAELRAFLAHITRGHTEKDGRWGKPEDGKRACPHNHKPASASTVKTYHAALRTLFRFLVAEDVLTESPMEQIKPPICRDDQPQPFTAEQVEMLLAAAKKAHHPKRDVALLLFLEDTGARASEVAHIQVRDVDLSERSVIVTGKGDKKRKIYFGATTARALFTYLREEEREERSPLFVSDAGHTSGEAMTRSGIRQLVERLGAKAGIESVSCNVHRYRHTFAVNFLRNGGNVFTLKELLGHTSLRMVNRYVALAQADLQKQHRQFSPVDRRRSG